MLPYQLQIVSLMAISLTQLGNVQDSIVTNIESFMLLHHPVLVGSCIIILFMLNLRNYIYFNSNAPKDTNVQN